jgi:hypothetical protein
MDGRSGAGSDCEGGLSLVLSRLPGLPSGSLGVCGIRMGAAGLLFEGIFFGPVFTMQATISENVENSTAARTIVASMPGTEPPLLILGKL